MTFQKGVVTNPEGRPKGSLNKYNAEVKEMIFKALLNLGGSDYLQDLATINPAAFASLVKALMPKDVKVSGKQDNEIILKILGMNADGNSVATFTTKAVSDEDME